MDSNLRNLDLSSIVMHSVDWDTRF